MHLNNSVRQHESTKVEKISKIFHKTTKERIHLDKNLKIRLFEISKIYIQYIIIRILQILGATSSAKY